MRRAQKKPPCQPTKAPHNSVSSHTENRKKQEVHTPNHHQLNQLETFTTTQTPTEVPTLAYPRRASPADSDSRDEGVMQPSSSNSLFWYCDNVTQNQALSLVLRQWLSFGRHSANTHDKNISCSTNTTHAIASTTFTSTPNSGSGAWKSAPKFNSLFCKT